MPYPSYPNQPSGSGYGYYYADPNADQPQHTGTLWHYLRILRRRIWIILPIVLITATIGTIRAFRAPDIYRAMTKILVERRAPDFMQFGHNVDDFVSWDPNFYSTQAELIRSRDVMERAMQQADIARLYEAAAVAATKQDISLFQEVRQTIKAALGAPASAPSEPWERLRGEIKARHVDESHFLHVMAESGSPVRAATLVNGTSKAFEEYHLEMKVETLGDAFIYLQKQKEKEEKELHQAEKELQQFRERAQGVSLELSGKDAPMARKLAGLNEQLTRIQLRRSELDAKVAVLKQIADSVSDDPAVTTDDSFMPPLIRDETVLASVRQELIAAEKQLVNLADVYGPAHPHIKSASSRVMVLRTEYRNTLAQVISAHNNDLAVLATQERDLQQQYKEQTATAMELAKEAFTFTMLRNTLDRHRKLHDDIVQRMLEVDISSGLQRTRVQVVEWAATPRSPLPHNRSRKILLSLFLGLFFGGGLAFFFESLDDTVKTPEDLKERFDVPLLGFIPLITADQLSAGPSKVDKKPGNKKKKHKKQRGKRRKRGLFSFLRSICPEFLPFGHRADDEFSAEEVFKAGAISVFEYFSSAAEAYRNLRTSLFYAVPAEELKVLAVTSSRPREGKTTTCTNLALTIAQSGRKVLLIDCDLHRDRVGKLMGVPKEHPGLTNVLVGELPWQDAACAVFNGEEEVPNLHVLPAGARSPSPAELLSSEKMKDLLVEMRGQYDWVLLDTPPVLFVSDASIVAALCDGVLFIVKAGTSNRALLARAKEQLEDLNIRIIGSVLNKVIISKLGRYYSYYGYYGYSKYKSDYHKTYYGSDEEDKRMHEAGHPEPLEQSEETTKI